MASHQLFFDKCHAVYGKYLGFLKTVYTCLSTFSAFHDVGIYANLMGKGGNLSFQYSF